MTSKTKREKGGSEQDEPPTFREAARRIQQEGEAMPFDEVLRRLVKAPPTPHDKSRKSGTRRQVHRAKD